MSTDSAARSHRFQITYDDPETGERKVHEGIYYDTPGIVTRPDGTTYDVGPISARQWAEDHAYALADKAMGTVKIKELPL